MDKSLTYWIKQGLYDLETAEAMLKTRRYLYVLFCSQQSVEKMLKACIAKRNKELPPRIHNLVRLLELSSLPADEKTSDFLRELSGYYIQTRYPDEIEEMAKQIDKKTAQRILYKTKEIVEWLQSILKS